MMAGSIKLSLASGEPTPPPTLYWLNYFSPSDKLTSSLSPTMIVSFILFFQKTSFLKPNMRLFINFEYHIAIIKYSFRG